MEFRCKAARDIKGRFHSLDDRPRNMAARVVHDSVPLWRPVECGLFGLHVLRVGEAANPNELSAVLAHPHTFDFDTVPGGLTSAEILIGAKSEPN